MQDKIYLIPKTGLKVPDPELGDHLPPKGREVVNSAYWRRRLKAKEVSIGHAPAAGETKAKSHKKDTAPAAEGGGLEQ